MNGNGDPSNHNNNNRSNKLENGTNNASSSNKTEDGTNTPNSLMTENKKAQRERSYAIDKQIEAESKKYRKECKILLLGESSFT